MVEIGITNTKSVMCTASNTALAMGSGDLEVFATPAMIALMEGTAAASVADQLEPGQTTVGTALDVAHTAASPVGIEITCTSELVEINGRELVFKVVARDTKGQIGEGIHKRFIVDAERFFGKTQKKLED